MEENFFLKVVSGTPNFSGQEARGKGHSLANIGIFLSNRRDISEDGAQCTEGAQSRQEQECRELLSGNIPEL